MVAINNRRCTVDQSLVNMPRTKRGLVTLNKILSAAAQVIYEKGYHEASINDITNLAGVAAGSFYTYFDGKYNLYKYMLLQCSHQIRKHLASAISECKTRREAEEVGLRSWLEFTMENQYMYHIIWQSLSVDYALFVDYYTTFGEAYKQGLDKAKAAGDLGDIDTEVLAFSLMGISNFLGLNWCLFKQDSSQIDHVVAEYMKLVDHGILPQMGSVAKKPTSPAKKLPPLPASLFQVEIDVLEDDM